MPLWPLRWKAVLNWLQIDPQFPRIHSPESVNSLLEENRSGTSSLASHSCHTRSAPEQFGGNKRGRFCPRFGKCSGSSQLLLFPCRFVTLCMRTTVCQRERKMKGNFGPGHYSPQSYPRPDVSWKGERNYVLGGWGGVKLIT